MDVHNLQSYSYCYFINIKFSELKRNRILNMHIYHFDDLNIEENSTQYTLDTMKVYINDVIMCRFKINNAHK